MKLSRLIQFLLQTEREDPDNRPVVLDIGNRKVIGIHEELDKIVIKTKEIGIGSESDSQGTSPGNG